MIGRYATMAGHGGPLDGGSAVAVVAVISAAAVVARSVAVPAGPYEDGDRDPFCPCFPSGPCDTPRETGPEALTDDLPKALEEVAFAASGWLSPDPSRATGGQWKSGICAAMRSVGGETNSTGGTD